jgi:transposase
LFGKEQFVYDPDTDTYRCPAGQTLTYRFDTVEKERHIRYYKTGACGGCPLKEKCTRNKEGRRITRWVDEHIIEETQQRVEAHPEIMQQRKELVEHPFGTIKHWWDQGHFLMKGLEKVRAEFSLSTLAYNIRRVLNILGVERLLAALRGGQKAVFFFVLASKPPFSAEFRFDGAVTAPKPRWRLIAFSLGA